MATDYSALSKLFGNPQQSQSPTGMVGKPAPSAATGLPKGYTDYRPVLDKLISEGKANPDGSRVEAPSAVEQVFSGLGNGLMKVLHWVDTPRAYVASMVKEVNDAWASSGVARWMGTGGHMPDWLIKQRTADEYNKYLVDSGAAGGFEWKDFWTQAKQHKGMGDYYNQIAPDRNIWVKRAVGFAGDLATDPTMVIAGGMGTAMKQGTKVVVKSAAEQLAEDALHAAIREGGSKNIAAAVRKSAEAAGFAMKEGGGFTDEAINRLLVDAQLRGNGAFTTRALAKSGITAEVAQQLGVGKLQRTLFGKAVPLSAMWADVVEGSKGGVKYGLRTSAVGQTFRAGFTSAERKGLMKVVFDTARPMGERAVALIASQGLEQPLRDARTWRGLTMRRVIQNFGGVVRDAEGAVDKVATKAAETAGAPAWTRASEDAAIAATHSIEKGGTGALEDVGRTELKTIREDGVAAGVQMGDLGEGYVPHIVTDKARGLAQKNAEVRKIFESLRDEQGFQKFRSLKKGSPFLDKPALEEGTIEEINGLFREKFGVNLFEDNLQVIMPKYVRSMETAIQRAKTVQQLEHFGMVQSKIETVVSKLNPDKSWVKEAERLRVLRDQAVGEQQVVLRNGATLRRDTIKQAKEMLSSQATKLRVRLREVEAELSKIEATTVRVQAKHDAIVAKLDSARKNLAAAKKDVAAFKGDARAQAVVAMNDAKKQVAVLSREQRAVVGEAKQLGVQIKQVAQMDVPVRQMAERTRPMVQARESLMTRQASLEAEKAALSEQMKGFADVIGNLSAEQQNTILATGRSADATVQRANSVVKQLNLSAKAAKDDVNTAVNAHLAAVADSQHVTRWLNGMLTDVQARLDSLGKVPALSKDQTVTLRLQNELKTRMETLLKVVADPAAPPEMRFLAQFEALASNTDFVAAEMGDSIGTLSDMIKIAKDKKFLQETVMRVGSGMTAIGEQTQMASWLFEATTASHIMNDISKMPVWMEKYVALFKGYATLRPGFHVRNAYSAMVNMYLEGGAATVGALKDWHEFYRMVDKNPENYMDAAVAKFGAERAGRLDQALQVMYGSGAGQVESVNALSSLGKGSLNPFDTNNKLFRKSRDAGSWIEDHVRGAHAYAVLERSGGNMDLAQQIVNKWHFNYTDIGSWDQKAKMIMPFWTFFSRDLALQSQTFVRNAARYNRLVGNFKRNMEMDGNDPNVVPRYFTQAGAIRLTGGANPQYLFTDLPMTLFPNKVSQITDPSRWSELLSQTSPLIKVPLEALTGKSLYTGIPFKDQYVPVPVGFQQAIAAVGGDLPTDVFAKAADGTPMMKASYANALQSLIPTTGQLSRLMPAGEGGGFSGQAFVSWLTGIGTRPLDARAQRGELLRRQQEAKNQARLQASLGFGA
jgi:hypothetical protein